MYYFTAAKKIPQFLFIFMFFYVEVSIAIWTKKNLICQKKYLWTLEHRKLTFISSHFSFPWPGLHWKV